MILKSGHGMITLKENGVKFPNTLVCIYVHRVCAKLNLHHESAQHGWEGMCLNFRALNPDMFKGYSH